jgi:hypothetical protein
VGDDDGSAGGGGGREERAEERAVRMAERRKAGRGGGDSWRVRSIVERVVVERGVSLFRVYRPVDISL